MKFTEFLNKHKELGISQMRFFHAFMYGHFDKNKREPICPFKKDTLKKAYYLGKDNRNEKIVKKLLEIY